MERPYQIKTSGRPDVAVERITALVQDMERVVRLLEEESFLSETSSGVNDRSNVAYPFLARALLERKQNLMESIGSLKCRLPNDCEPPKVLAQQEPRTGG
jgi:hypothetical protein